LAIAVTGAASVVSTDYRVDFVGTDNRFALAAAASADPAWHPTAADWEDAAEVPIELRLTVDGAQYELAPGDSVEMKVAVKNPSPLAGLLSLRIEDPHRSTGTLPASDGGGLFSQLQFTVTETDKVLLDHASAEKFVAYSWPFALEHGESKVLNVRVSIPEDLDAHWLNSGTDIRFRFQGENA
jgi:hypothetical protein